MPTREWAKTDARLTPCVPARVKARGRWTSSAVWFVMMAGLGLSSLGVWCLSRVDRTAQHTTRPFEYEEHSRTSLHVDRVAGANSVKRPTGRAEAPPSTPWTPGAGPPVSDLGDRVRDPEQPAAEVEGAVSEQGLPDAGASIDDRTTFGEDPPGEDPLGDDGPAPAVVEPTPRTSARGVAPSSWRVRRQPGLCNDPEDAIEARQTLMRHFRNADWNGHPLLYMDPRLPNEAHPALIRQLEHAEREASAALRAEVPRPEVFAYFDRELLLAAACTNDDVVAYYDGALHVVLPDADVQQSVVHEYTHHVLMSSGVLGPAWAHEGIAMTVARERWWRGPWLQRVAETPFSLDAMDEGVPYTMTSEQAVLFYVQSAAMVTCAARDEPDDVAGLLRTLHGEHSGSGATCQLPDPAEPAHLRSCVNSLR